MTAALKTKPAPRAKASPADAATPAGPFEVPPVERSPIELFKVAPENPRAHRKEVEDLGSLAPLVRKYGVVNPVICYLEGKTLWVTAGRRRLAAASDVGAEELPHRRYPKDIAIQLGLAEQEGHRPLHVADQARAWALRLRQGGNAVEIANDFGVTELTVRQRARLGDMHAPILDALGANRIDLAVAKAFANAEPDQQISLWKKFGRGGDRLHIQVWQLREAINQKKISATDSIARFVSEKAYVEAGGRIQQDLFNTQAHRDDDDSAGLTYWLDPAIAEKLADEKFAEKIEELKKAGWGFVMRDDGDAWRTLEYSQAPKTMAERKKFGLVLALDGNGKIATQVGKRIRTTAGKRLDDAPAAVATPNEPGKPAPQPPISHTAHEQLTRAAGGIVGYALAKTPELALAALIAQLARKRWGKPEGDQPDVLAIYPAHMPHGIGARQQAPQLQCESGKGGTDEMEETWREKLAADLDDAEAVVFRWPLKDKLSCLAFLLGQLVILTEPRADAPRKLRRRRAAELASLASVQPAEFYAVSVDVLKGFSRGELTKIAKELGVEEGKTKGQTAEIIALAAADKGWVPKVVRELCGVPVAAKVKKPAAKAAAKKKAA